MRRRTSCRLFVLAAALACAACETDRELLFPEPPTPDSPEQLLENFLDAYSKGNRRGYERLFTLDFRFFFSSSDTTLVQEFPDGWTFTDEVLHASRLFRGGVNRNGDPVRAASEIDFTISDRSVEDDTTAGRDPARYRVLTTNANLRVIVPPFPGTGDTTIYAIGQSDPAVQRLWFVRGDAADSLAGDQPANADHWYFWKWEDLTIVSGPPPVPVPAARGRFPTAAVTEEITWGRLKGIYR